MTDHESKFTATDRDPIKSEILRALGEIADDNDVAELAKGLLTTAINEADLTMVGVSRAAEILGVSRQRVHQLEENSKMPRSLVTETTGNQRIKTFWLKSDVISFAEQRQPLRQITTRKSYPEI